MTLHSAQWALWDAVNLRDGCCAKSSSPAEWKIAEHFASVLNVRGDLVWTWQLHWHTLLGPQNKCFKFQTGAGGHWEYFAQLPDTDTSLLSKQCTTQCMPWDATGSRRVFWHRFNLSMVFTSFCQCPLSRFSWAPPHPSCPSYRAPWGHKTFSSSLTTPTFHGQSAFILHESLCGGTFNIFPFQAHPYHHFDGSWFFDFLLVFGLESSPAQKLGFKIYWHETENHLVP